MNHAGVSDQTKAPWTPEEVESLNGYQVGGVFHPFTCGECRDRLGTRFIREDDGTLRPETDAEWAEVVQLPIGHPRVQAIVLDDHLLTATENGWVCPTCDQTQDWAWTWMADGSWRSMILPAALHDG